MGTVSFYRIAGGRTWHFGRMQLSNPMATAEPVRSILRAGFDSQNWALVRSDCLTRPPGVGVGDRSDLHQQPDAIRVVRQRGREGVPHPQVLGATRRSRIPLLCISVASRSGGVRWTCIFWE